MTREEISSFIIHVVSSPNYISLTVIVFKNTLVFGYIQTYHFGHESVRMEVHKPNNAS